MEANEPTFKTGYYSTSKGTLLVFIVAVLLLFTFIPVFGSADTGQMTVYAEDPADMPDDEQAGAGAPDGEQEAVTQGDEATIADVETPLARGKQHSWALINLILAILTGLMMLFIFIFWLMNRKNEKRENNQIVRNGLLRLLSIVATAQAIALFVLKESFTFEMRLTDRYTIYHVCLLLAVIILAVMTMGRQKTEND